MSNRAKRARMLSSEKQALLALTRMEAKLDELKRLRKEPIAIIGMGCRFPGGANNTDAFWQLLQQGGGCHH